MVEERDFFSETGNLKFGHGDYQRSQKQNVIGSKTKHGGLVEEIISPSNIEFENDSNFRMSANFNENKSKKNKKSKKQTGNNVQISTRGGQDF